MAWVRMDDKLHENAKLDGVSDAAFRLWVLALSWSNDKLTDGHLPTARPARLMTLRNPKKTIDELLAAKLWHHSGRTCTSCLAQRAGKKVLGDVPSGGYVIHHYFDYQKPAWVIRQEREQRIEAGRRGGSSKGRKGSESLSEPLPEGDDRDQETSSESLSGPLSEMPSGPLSEPLEHLAKRAVLSEMPNPVPPYPRNPVPVAIATRTPRAREDEDAARSSSQVRREGWQHVGVAARQIVSTARGAS